MRLAEEYPEDDRNGWAAEALAKLAGTPLGQEFADLQEKINAAEWRGSDCLIEDEDRHRSRVGFDSFPDSGEAYIRDRMEIYAEALREAEEEAAEEEADEDDEDEEDKETLVAFELDAAVAALARARMGRTARPSRGDRAAARRGPEAPRPARRGRSRRRDDA